MKAGCKLSGCEQVESDETDTPQTLSGYRERTDGRGAKMDRHNQKRKEVVGGLELTWQMLHC